MYQITPKFSNISFYLTAYTGQCLLAHMFPSYHLWELAHPFPQLLMFLSTEYVQCRVFPKAIAISRLSWRCGICSQLVTQLSAGLGSLLFDFWLEASFHTTGTYLISGFTNEITQYRVSFLSFFPPRNINIL